MVTKSEHADESVEIQGARCFKKNVSDIHAYSVPIAAVLLPQYRGLNIINLLSHRSGSQWSNMGPSGLTSRLTLGPFWRFWGESFALFSPFLRGWLYSLAYDTVLPSWKPASGCFFTLLWALWLFFFFFFFCFPHLKTFLIVLNLFLRYKIIPLS